MRTRWTVNLLLLVLVAVLSTAVQRQLERDRRVPTLTELEPSRIQAIELERPGQPLVRLERDANDWNMTTPFRTAADGTRIGQLVRIASTPVHRANLQHAQGTVSHGPILCLPRVLPATYTHQPSLLLIARRIWLILPLQVPRSRKRFPSK